MKFGERPRDHNAHTAWCYRANLRPARANVAARLAHSAQHFIGVSAALTQCTCKSRTRCAQAGGCAGIWAYEQTGDRLVWWDYLWHADGNFKYHRPPSVEREQAAKQIQDTRQPFPINCKTSNVLQSLMISKHSPNTNIYIDIDRHTMSIDRHMHIILWTSVQKPATPVRLSVYRPLLHLALKLWHDQ